MGVYCISFDLGLNICHPHANVASFNFTPIRFFCVIPPLPNPASFNEDPEVTILLRCPTWYWTTSWLCIYFHTLHQFLIYPLWNLGLTNTLRFFVIFFHSRIRISSFSPWHESLLFLPYTNLLFFSLVRICLEANMVGNNTVRSSSTPSVEFSSLPRCGCDRAMKMWVANTVQNRNGSSGDVVMQG